MYCCPNREEEWTCCRSPDSRDGSFFTLLWIEREGEGGGKVRDLCVLVRLCAADNGGELIHRYETTH